MRSLITLAFLAACSPSEPDWLEDSVPVTLRTCDGLTDNDSLPDLAIWYDDGFGLQFDDVEIASAEGCWTYTDGRAVLRLQMDVQEVEGAESTLRVDAFEVMQQHAEVAPEDGLTFVHAGETLQSVDLDWSTYRR